MKPYASIVSSMLLVGACAFGSQPQAAPPMEALTPAEAAKVVKDVFATGEKARLHWDVKLNDTVEAGAAGAEDDAAMRAAVARKQAPQAQPRPLNRVTVFVPHQQSYPAQFLAQIETVKLDGALKPTTQPDVELGVIQKTGATSGWKLVLYVPVPAAGIAKPAILADGYVELVSKDAGAGDLALPPSTLAPAYAVYMNDFIQKGTSNTGLFTAGPLTKDLAAQRRDQANAFAGRGFVLKSNYSDAPEYGIFSYRAADRSALVFSSTREAITIAAGKPGLCLQQDPGLAAFGPFVAPGKYASLSFTNVGMLYGQIPPVQQSSGPQHVNVLGVAASQVAAQGTGC